MQVIVARVQDEIDEIAETCVERFHTEIIDYRAIKDAARNDVRTMALSLVEDVLAAMRLGAPIDLSHLESFRHSGSRRVYQGVSLESLLKAYRIWTQVVWSYIGAAATTPAERDAALWMVQQLLIHVDVCSTLVAKAYSEELTGIRSDRDVLRLDELEALLSQPSLATARVRREVQETLNDATSFAVIVVAPRDQRAPTANSRSKLLAALRQELKPRKGVLLSGVREREAIAIYPVYQPAEKHLIEEQATSLARSQPSYVVGIGHEHSGPAAIFRSYDEARRAVAIAAVSPEAVRAITFADVLLIDLLQGSRHAQTLLDDTIAPLATYDKARTASLVATLEAYFECGLSLTRSGAMLHVHPNTVAYRLSRIEQLTGRDPMNSSDLLLLVLGLKLWELSGPRSLG